MEQIIKDIIKKQSELQLDIQTFEIVMVDVQFQLNVDERINTKQIQQIFEIFDKNKTGFLEKKDVECILIEIMEQSLTDRQKLKLMEQQESQNQIYFDIQEKVFTDKKKNGSFLDNISISSEMIDNFSLEDITEIKQIYHLVHDQIIKEEEFLSELSSVLDQMDFKLNIPKQQIQTFFDTIKDENGRINQQFFGEFMSQLEKRIYDIYENMINDQSMMQANDKSQSLNYSQNIEQQESSSEDELIYENHAEIIEEIRQSFQEQLRNQSQSSQIDKQNKKFENRLHHLMEIYQNDKLQMQRLEYQEQFSTNRIKDLEQQINKQIRAIDEIEMQNNKLYDNEQSLIYKINSLEKQFKQNKTFEIRIQELEDIIKEHKQKNYMLEEQMSKLKNEKKKQSVQYDQMSQIMQQNMKKMEEINSEHDSMRKSSIINDQNLQNRLRLISIENKEIEDKYKETAKNTINLINELNETNDKNQKLQGVVDIQQQQIQNLQIQIKELKQEYNDFKEKCMLNINSNSMAQITSMNIISNGNLDQKDMNIASMRNNHIKSFKTISRNNKEGNQCLEQQLIEDSEDEDSIYSGQEIQPIQRQRLSINHQDSYQRQSLMRQSYNRQSSNYRVSQGQFNQIFGRQSSLNNPENQRLSVNHFQVYNMENDQNQIHQLKEDKKINQSEKEDNQQCDKRISINIEVAKANQGIFKDEYEDKVIVVEYEDKEDQINDEDEDKEDQINDEDEEKEDQDKLININPQTNTFKVKTGEVFSITSQDINQFQGIEIEQKEQKQAMKINFNNIEQSVRQRKENIQKDQQVIPDSQKFSHELSIFSKDYLNIVQNEAIIKLLKFYNDPSVNYYENIQNTSQFQFYSDIVIKVNNKQQQKKRVIFITQQAIYLLYKEKYKIYRRIMLKDIVKLQFNQQSLILVKFVLRKSQDLVITTFKRTDLVLFLMETFRKQKIPQFKREICNEIFSNQTQSKVKQQKQKAKNIHEYMNNPELIEGYMNSNHHGYFYMKKKGLFREKFKKYFFVLTNIGMICLRKPEDDIPKLIIPVIGNEIKVIKNSEKNKKDKDFMFELSTKSQKEYTFQCESKEELEGWIESIKKLQQQADENRQALNEQIIQ